MDKEDHRRFMPPGYNSPSNNYCEVVCAMCEQSIAVDIDNRPSPSCVVSGIELDYQPDQNGPLNVIQCPHCMVSIIAVKKRWRFTCKFCASIQPLIEKYQYHVDLENKELVKSIENGTFNMQTCSNCNRKNYHQFAIEVGLMIYKLIRSINPDCEDSEDLLENARTWYWIKKYDLSYTAFIKGEIELLSSEKNPDKVFSDYITMACVLEKLEKRDEMPLWFQKALDIKPNNAMALKALGYTFLNLQQWDEAIRPFEKIVQEKIQISDMFVDNVNLQHEALCALETINHYAGNIEKTKYWEKEREELTAKYSFLRSQKE